MSGTSPAFSWYPKDYESDEHVKLMSLDQEGAYLRLLNHAWLHGSIPDNTRAMALICRTTPAKMARLWPGIKPCWADAGPGRLANGRQERERAGQAARRVVQSEKGKRGAAAKWHGHSPSHGLGDARAIRRPMPGDGFPSPSASANGSTEEGSACLPAADRTERAIRQNVEALRSRLYGLIDEMRQLDPKGRDPTELMRFVTGYQKSDGTTVKGVVNAAMLTFERLEKSIEDAEANISDWKAARK